MRFILYLIFLIFSVPVLAQVNTIYVSPNGSDKYNGTQAKPLKTIEQALSMGRSKGYKKVSIHLLEGTYYLEQTVKINSETDSFEDLEIRSHENQRAIISAGKLLKPVWSHFKNGIYRTSVPKDISFEGLYVNGILQTMARYPNRDTTKNIFDGTAEDATYYMRVLTWGNPFGGYVHALDEHERGSLHYKITGVDDTDNVELDGGWQNKNPLHMHNVYRFVENILVELDAPGEWYHDKSVDALYYYPETGTDMSNAVVEVSNLHTSFEITGTEVKPIKNVTLKDLHFRHNERSFMKSNEYLLGSDWAVFRSGSVVLSNTEHCKIEDCTFIGQGGNAVVFNHTNKEDTVKGCLISNIGGSGISLLGSPPTLILTSERKSISVQDNLIQYVGQIEKQGTAIHINSISGLSIKNNTFFHTPGAGIKIENSKTENIDLDLNDIFEDYLELKKDIDKVEKLPGNGSKPISNSGVQKPTLKEMTIKFK